VRAKAKVDANQSRIVDALRKAGCTVQSLGAVGAGCPDLLVGFGNRNLLLEVKDGSLPPSKKRLNHDQAAWHATWRGQVSTVTNIREALDVVGF